MIWGCFRRQYLCDRTNTTKFSTKHLNMDRDTMFSFLSQTWLIFDTIWLLSLSCSLNSMNWNEKRRYFDLCVGKKDRTIEKLREKNGIVVTLAYYIRIGMYANMFGNHTEPAVWQMERSPVLLIWEMQPIYAKTTNKIYGNAEIFYIKTNNFVICRKDDGKMHVKCQNIWNVSYSWHSIDISKWIRSMLKIWIDVRVNFVSEELYEVDLFVRENLWK